AFVLAAGVFCVAALPFAAGAVDFAPFFGVAAIADPPRCRATLARRPQPRQRDAKARRMSSARRRKLSAVDTAWLRMDRPGNLMMICGVLVFGERVTRARLLRVLESRFLAFPRFRERPVETPA